ncbi:MAG: hypothetical protein L0229_25255 [Blastocatellia bacterium]|nr:hypothetical protein [Blastocatellia bacterium]
MKLTEEELKRIYQRGTARRLRQGRECLSPETFERAAMGEMNSSERERMTSHLMICSDCAREYRAVRSLGAVFEQPLSGKETMPAARSQRLWERLSPSAWRAAAALSAVILAITVSLTLWLNSRQVYVPQSSERGGVTMRLTVEPSDKAQLSEAPQKLVRSVVERAESYRVALYDYESTLIWESPSVTDTSITLPQAVRNDLKPGKLFYWQVTVQEGIESRRSDVFQFTIR